MNVQLILVDPQNDFCDPNGSLFVPGGWSDMGRLAEMVARLGRHITGIHVTLDSHHPVEISHPAWWRSVADGSRPHPFTILRLAGDRILAADPETSRPTGVEYTTANPESLPRTVAYLKALEAGGKYPHCVWPPHCLIGSWGHNVHPALFKALSDWETGSLRTVEYVLKGMNPWTEHFSAIRAEVPDPEDPSTQLNRGLIEAVERADFTAIGGEALSHCVASTCRDIVANLSDPKAIERIFLLPDTTSSVSGFEGFGAEFLREMNVRGMKLIAADEFLKNL